MAESSGNSSFLKDELKIEAHIQKVQLQLQSQLETELEISTALKDNSKKLPKDCLESMRQVAEKLKETSWCYPNVNKLLGLQ